MDILLTAYDWTFRPLGDLTSPLMLSYAGKHGMDFKCSRKFPEGIPAYWHKMNLVLESFRQGYERVMWLDADQIVTNSDFFPEVMSGFNASLDWGADAADESFFSTCGFVAFPDSAFLFEWALGHWAEYMDEDFPEMTPLRHLYRTTSRAKACIKVNPRRLFNAVPFGITEGVQEPWQPGDWLCHLTHVPVYDRVRMFHKIIGQL